LGQIFLPLLWSRYTRAMADKIGLFPGTFDPITNGHLDVIVRGQELFDRLIVAVGHNPAKQQLFPVEERVDLISQLMKQHCGPQVEVASFEGLTVDYARSVSATAILRGLRNVTDLNFEFQLALTNRAIADIETVFVMTGENNAFTSSTLIKQIASGGDIDRLNALLPPIILNAMKQKKDQHGGRIPWGYKDHLKESEH